MSDNINSKTDDVLTVIPKVREHCDTYICEYSGKKCSEEEIVQPNVPYSYLTIICEKKYAHRALGDVKKYCENNNIYPIISSDLPKEFGFETDTEFKIQLPDGIIEDGWFIRPCQNICMSSDCNKLVMILEKKFSLKLVIVDNFCAANNISYDKFISVIENARNKWFLEHRLAKT